MSDRINSTLSFRNTDAETGEIFMNIDITWGKVRPAFVNLMGDALIDTTVKTTLEVRRLAVEAAKAEQAGA